MTNAQEAKESGAVVAEDLQDLYIGNINTVDADLTLPRRGKRGSSISWESREILFISHDGKVTRPTYGVGNRVVPLVATASYAGSTAQRVFPVTVLERPREAAIVEIREVRLRTAVGEAPDLPPVVIARDDSGAFTTLPVRWESPDLPQAPGVVRISGRAEGSDLPARAEVAVAASAKKTPRQAVLPVAHAVKNGDVTLKPGSRFFRAQERMIQFLLTVDDDRMLYNFRVAAGLDTKGAEAMTGWDSPDGNLRGHTTGHYLSGLALAWSASGNPRLREKIDYLVHSLGQCQKAQSETGSSAGFLSAYAEKQFALLETFATYPTIWAPYYTLDKILSGLLDCHELAGNREALRIATDMGLWAYNRLSKLPRTQLDRMWSIYVAGEFGGMIGAMTRLYGLTRDERYLKTAYCFRNEKLFYPMQENVDTLKDMHANQHIPQAIGALALYEAGGAERYYRIADNFWHMATKSHAYSFGGVGETEMFHQAYDIAHYLTEKSAESCASYNMLRLAAGLFRHAPTSEKMDYCENVLFNHILASASRHADGGTTYFMPACPGGRKLFQTEENTCCHGTGLETRMHYTRDIYFLGGKGGKDLYINLYIPSTLAINGSWKVDLAEERPGVYLITVAGNAGGDAAVALRIPDWAGKRYEIAVEGGRLQTGNGKDGYVRIAGMGNGEGRIRIRFPYRFREIAAPDGSGFSSLAYGPYVLAALSDQHEFLPFPDAEQLAAASEAAPDDSLRFRIGGKTYIPVADVDDELYHVYFKRPESDSKSI